MTDRTSTASRLRGASTFAILTAALVGAANASRADEVTIYSYREPALIEPLLQAFTKETGIAANVVFANEGLIERASAEGANSPVDVILTNEFGLLLQARDAGLTAPLTDAAIVDRIPAQYRDPDGHWLGLTLRARVVYASKARVAADAITYEELAEPKWRGKICSRSGQHTYNVSLVAAMIAHLGPDGAETWLKGVKENLARKPAGGDRDQVKAVFTGECDLAIGNTYYMAAMLANDRQPEQKQWAASVKILFPTVAGAGTHVNISGAALIKTAPHKDAALKLIAYLASDRAQTLYASANGEYPIVAGLPASDLVAGFGVLKPDGLALETIGKLRRAASELVDKVGFDSGPGT